jgi:hypothetical protein
MMIMVVRKQADCPSKSNRLVRRVAISGISTFRIPSLSHLQQFDVMHWGHIPDMSIPLLVMTFPVRISSESSDDTITYPKRVEIVNAIAVALEPREHKIQPAWFRTPPFLQEVPQVENHLGSEIEVPDD